MSLPIALMPHGLDNCMMSWRTDVPTKVVSEYTTLLSVAVCITFLLSPVTLALFGSFYLDLLNNN